MENPRSTKNFEGIFIPMGYGLLTPPETLLKTWVDGGVPRSQYGHIISTLWALAGVKV